MLGGCTVASWKLVLALVDDSRNTTASVAERKSALESLVTTIDLRTADLDQRLSRFIAGVRIELIAMKDGGSDASVFASDWFATNSTNS
jgi:predicted TIM-barrel fold metal-dependent hydrolase